MSKHVFGKAIEFSFTPHVDGAPIAVKSLVSARIYSDAPTDAQTENTASGHIQEVTSWADNGTNERIITFSAVTDSDPHSSDDFEKYFVVINYKLETLGPTVFDKEVIFLYRPDSYTSRISVSPADVLALEPDLERAGVTSAMLQKYITDAKDYVLKKLRSSGKQLKRLYNLEELNAAVRYRAAAMACVSRYRTESPHWLTKYNINKDEFEVAFAAMQVGYDVAGEDEPAGTERTENNVAWLVR